MRFGAADDVVEDAVAELDVAVLKESVRRVRDVVEREHRRVHRHQQEGQAVERHLHGFLEQMKARSVQPVQLLDRMMHRMEPPQASSF